MRASIVDYAPVPAARKGLPENGAAADRGKRLPPAQQERYDVVIFDVMATLSGLRVSHTRRTPSLIRRRWGVGCILGVE